MSAVLRPFQPAYLFLTHAGFGEEADHSIPQCAIITNAV
jgi:hypothetical protein